MSQNTLRSESIRASSKVMTSRGSEGSAATFTANTARTSLHGVVLPDRATSSCASEAFSCSMRASCSASSAATASRSVGLPSPMSPPEKKMPNAEAATSPTRQMTTTATAATAPRLPSAAMPARAWSAAILANRVAATRDARAVRRDVRAAWCAEPTALARAAPCARLRTLERAASAARLPMRASLRRRMSRIGASRSVSSLLLLLRPAPMPARHSIAVLRPGALPNARTPFRRVLAPSCAM